MSALQTARPGICIVSHTAYGAICGGSLGHIGGVDRQTSLLACWLADHGYPVSLVTWDEGQGDDCVIDGVRILRLCRRDAGVPGLRFFTPRWTSLNAALRRANADLYYHNCAEYVTGQIAMWCRRHGRKFVYSAASDMDCDPSLPEMRTLRERVLYPYGLRHAHGIIVQTRTQQEMLRSGFRLGSVIIPTPCPGPSESDYEQRQPPSEDHALVVWVGRIVELKRLEWLLDVAERLPEVDFEVAGEPKAESEYTRGLRRRAAGLKNVTLLGRVERARMSEVYARASCLCCTSRIEGFPNTFLEAWSYGVPVVSTFDPDHLISRERLGETASDVDGLVCGLKRLLTDPARWLEASRQSRRYYLQNHTVDAVMRRFESLFLDLMGRRPGDAVESPHSVDPVHCGRELV